MDTRSYKVISQIKFEGRIRPAGDTVELTDDQTRQFAGCVELSDGQVTVAADDLKCFKKDFDSLVEQIDQLKGQLSARDSELATLTAERDGLLQEKGDLKVLGEKMSAELAAGLEDKEKDTARINILLDENEKLNTRIAELEKQPAKKK